jgi:hypothetical protein
MPPVIRVLAPPAITTFGSEPPDNPGPAGGPRPGGNSRLPAARTGRKYISLRPCASASTAAAGGGRFAATSLWARPQRSCDFRGVSRGAGGLESLPRIPPATPPRQRTRRVVTGHDSHRRRDAAHGRHRAPTSRSGRPLYRHIRRGRSRPSRGSRRLPGRRSKWTSRARHLARSPAPDQLEVEPPSTDPSASDAIG